MANYGTTTITITGSEEQRAALHAALIATAYGSLAFSLRGIAPEIWTGDGLLRNAEIKEKDGCLQLYTCMAYDGDCLPLAASLSRRDPTLRIQAWFQCEGEYPNFTASAHANGSEIYEVHFEVEYSASIAVGPDRPRTYWHIPFHQRTAERDLAADDVLAGTLSTFLDQPPVIDSWRRSDDPVSSTVYLLAAGDDAGHLVLTLDAMPGSATLLRDVAPSGGYRLAETITLDAVRARLPALALELELDRVEQEVAKQRAEWLAAQSQNVPSDTEGEIPF